MATFSSKFVIELNNTFVGIDHISGGCKYWSSYIGNAKLFNSKESAEEFLNGSDFTKEVKMSDGMVYPPHMIHSGLNISYDNISASGTINIMEITLTPVMSKNVSYSIHENMEDERKEYERLKAIFEKK
jgi:hypothetical protein